MEIDKLIYRAESKTLEFKRDLSSITPILKTIVAFANTAGGILIIGRSSDGSIEGIKDPFDAEERLANAISDSIRPSILPEIEVATVEGKHLLVIQVAHWKGPFYLKSQGTPAGVYIRLGSTSRPVSADMLAEMQRSIARTSFDQEPVSELTAENLDYERVKQAFIQMGKSVDRQKMRSLGLLTNFADRLVPSVGGLILFGNEEIRSRFVPDARVSCARFRGIDKTHIIDRYEIEGTILDAVTQVLNFIARNTRLLADISANRRTDIPEYPPLAIREALINALAHADYTITGSHTRISIFSDRLEISNPGMLPFGYTLEDLIGGVSRVRNRVIVRTFRELDLMEEWGSGYRRIVSNCEEKGYPIPKWEEMALSICVTFYPHPGTVLSDTSVSKELSARQQSVLALLNAEGVLSSREIAKLLGESISDRAIRYDLAHLKDLGMIKSVGRGSATRWTSDM